MIRRFGASLDSPWSTHWKKWGCHLKMRIDRSAEKHKVTLVAKDFLQRSGVDLIETNSPVTKYSTLTIL